MAPVQGMQGEVEIIYQILGSDRQRMVSAAPHASDFLRRNRHSNRVSASRGLRFRETGFQGQRKMRRNDLPTRIAPILTPAEKPVAFKGPFATV